MKTLKLSFTLFSMLFFFTTMSVAQIGGEENGEGNQTESVCNNWWIGSCGAASSINRTGTVHIGASGTAIPEIDFQVTGNTFISNGALYGNNTNDNGFVLKAGTPSIDGSYFHLRSTLGTGNISAVLRGGAPQFRVMYNAGGSWKENFIVKHDGGMIGRKSLRLDSDDATIPFVIKEGPGGADNFVVRNNGESFSKSFRVGPSFWNPDWDHFKIQDDGKVIIGDASEASEGFLLAVADGIQTQKLKVCASASSWCDYVFEEDYKRNSLKKIEAHIKEHKHLPNVPSAQEVEENGINVAEMDAVLLRQVEELWLHMIDMKKENEVLKAELAQLKKSK